MFTTDYFFNSIWFNMAASHNLLNVGNTKKLQLSQFYTYWANVWRLTKTTFVFYELSGLHEFDAQKNHEVDEFRSKMRTFCEEKAQERQNLPWQQWMEYSFPCDLEPCCCPPVHGGTKLKTTKKLFLNVKFEACDVSGLSVWVMSHAVELWVEAAVVKPAERAETCRIKNM